MDRVAMAAAVVVATSAVAALGVTTVGADLTGAGVAFNPGVRGTAVPSIGTLRGGTQVGNPKSLEVSRGSSIRGVFGGLEADTMDWRTRNFDARPTTLDYLRHSRDFGTDLVITTNVRGLTRRLYPGTTDYRKEFYDTSVSTVTQMAAEWVRYTNRIAQVYRQGDAITDARDKAVLDSLSWSTGVWYDIKETLPAAGEAALPKVTYWEIGNEPRVGLSSSYQVVNSYTFYPPARAHQTDPATHKFDFTERYASMTLAMRAEDPTIKVGPCLQSGAAVTEKEILQDVLKRQSSGQYLPVDFISYHPYQRMGDVTEPAAVTQYLQAIYGSQKVFTDRLRDLVQESGRPRDSVELIASEQYVSYFTYNDQPSEARMAHALGTVETVFSFARLGVSAAHYWVFPAHQEQGTEYPVYKAYEGMRDHMGDTMLDVREDGATRVYTTRDSKTGEVAVWGLNFSNDADATVELGLCGLSELGYRLTLKTLRDVDGATTLTSGNYAYGMAGWPAQEVDWVVEDWTGRLDPAGCTITLPAATISVLVLEPIAAVPEPAGAAAVAAAVAALAARRRQAR